MAAIEFDSLDVEQGYNFKADIQKNIGHIISLQIGTVSNITQFKADTQLQSPMDPVNTLKPKVGVMSSVTWGGGYGDPMEFKFHVSTQNKQKLSNLIHGGLSDTTVNIEFAVWEYDPVAATWYLAFGTSAITNCLITKEDKDLKITVAKEPGAIKSPMNWEITLSLVPAPKEQGMYFATASLVTVAKQWGITVAT
jgi:hypothetical protein